MTWLAALMLERWRRWGFLVLLGAFYGLLARQLPDSTTYLVGITGYASVTEGLSAWLSELRHGRLAYYRAWGIGQGALALRINAAALLPVLLLVGLAAWVSARPALLGGQLAMGALTALLGASLSTALWRRAAARPWLARALPVASAFMGAALAEIVARS